MAANNRTRVRREEYYVQGNTVRKTAPERRMPQQRTMPERREREARRPVINHRVRRNQDKALYMDLPYVIMLTVAACCALYICVGYLQVQSSISSRIHHIEQLEQSLETLKSTNDALETRINTYVDLDYVYEVATKELGMVYANKDQVLLYDKTESEYVRQYEDIPGN